MCTLVQYAGLRHRKDLSCPPNKIRGATRTNNCSRKGKVRRHIQCIIPGPCLHSASCPAAQKIAKVQTVCQRSRSQRRSRFELGNHHHHHHCVWGFLSPGHLGREPGQIWLSASPIFLLRSERSQPVHEAKGAQTLLRTIGVSPNYLKHIKTGHLAGMQVHQGSSWWSWPSSSGPAQQGQYRCCPGAAPVACDHL